LPTILLPTGTVRCFTLPSLKSMVRQGIPVIVLQKASKSNPYGHYKVVVGCDEQLGQLRTYDPALGMNYGITYGLFADLWLPGSTFSAVNWSLVIRGETDETVILTGRLQPLIHQYNSSLSSCSSELNRTRLTLGEITLQRNTFAVLSACIPPLILMHSHWRGRRNVGQPEDQIDA